jgi:hypothetical protein
MAYARMLDKANQPTEQDVLTTIGDVTHWLDLRQYLNDSYDFTPELINYGKYGWTFRYRKSGKTLCSLYPETGAFTVLLVLGRREAEKALSYLDQFNPDIQQVLTETEQLHDGRWLWLRVLKESDVDDIKTLLTIKRKPNIGNKK